MKIQPIAIPKNKIAAGEDRKVYDWVLTTTGESTPNSLHYWDMGNPAMEEELYWNDDWYYTENENS